MAGNPMSQHQRHYDFSQPLDESWEVIPQKGWTFETSAGRARFSNTTAGKAEIYVRPCSVYGDTIELRFVPGAPRAGVFVLGLIVGFEFIYFRLNLTDGKLTIVTHEAHKPQPRFAGR